MRSAGGKAYLSFTRSLDNAHEYCCCYVPTRATTAGISEHNQPVATNRYDGRGGCLLAQLIQQQWVPANDFFKDQATAALVDPVPRWDTESQMFRRWILWQFYANEYFDSPRTVLHTKPAAGPGWISLLPPPRVGCSFEFPCPQPTNPSSDGLRNTLVRTAAFMAMLLAAGKNELKIRAAKLSG